MLTFGPQIVIEEEFRDLADVDQVVVYGSWARRHNGETGREPADLNVMVIGSPERDAVYAAAERREQRLDMAVNPTVRSAKAWPEESDALPRQIASDGGSRWDSSARPAGKTSRTYAVRRPP